MKFTFKIGQKIKESWFLFKNNFWIFFLLSSIVFFFNILSSKHSLVLNLLVLILCFFVAYMTIRYVISLVDKKEFNIFSKDSLPTLEQILNFVKTYILFFLIVLGGFFVFIIPSILMIFGGAYFRFLVSIFIILALVCLVLGIYFKIRLLFSCINSVDKNQGAVKSIKKSWSLTRNLFWPLFWRIIVIGLFMFSGAIIFFIGLIVTVPMGLIMIVMLFRTLENPNYQNQNINDNDDLVVEEDITIIKEEGSPIVEIIKEEKIIGENNI